MSSSIRIAFAALAVALIGGCATVQVRGVGTNTGQAAYDLSGPDLGSLVAEAVRLCPHGHAVMRQWQRSNRPAGDGNEMTDWLAATALLSYDLQPDQARMSIVCTV